MSVHRREDGTGRVRFQVKWREGDRQRSRTFTRKGDAESWDSEVKRRAQLGPMAVQQLTSTGPTLGDWIAERWIPEHAATLEKLTRRRYADAYELHIAEHLGERPLRDLTVGTLRAWQADRLADGVSAGTIDKCRTVLSSVLRHAAESEAIPANPIGLVRPPKSEHRDSVKPLAPATVERVRWLLGHPMDTTVPARRRPSGMAAAYDIADARPELELQRDAAIVSILAYAGIRPGELRGLRWSDVREATITVERAADDDGRLKSTKTSNRRAVRLLPSLASDLRSWRRSSKPSADDLLLPGSGVDGAWDKTDWQVWRAKRWRKACDRAGLDAIPRPYDLRHSFASLLLAEGRSVHYVSRQLGNSAALVLSTYGHLFDEYAEAEKIDPETEIASARLEAPSRSAGSREVPELTESPAVA